MPSVVVADFIAARTGLSFPAAQHIYAEAGIRRAMSRAGIADVAGYVRRLEGNEELYDDLITELTVGETYFLREPAQSGFVRDTVIPDISRRRSPDHPLRFWSAGCASGEEAYSLAFLLEEGLRRVVLSLDGGALHRPPELPRQAAAVCDG